MPAKAKAVPVSKAGGKRRALTTVPATPVDKITVSRADFDITRDPFELLIEQVLERNPNLTTVAKGSSFEIIVTEFLKVRYAQDAHGQPNGTSVELTSAALGNRGAGGPSTAGVPMPGYGDGGRDIVVVHRSNGLWGAPYGIWVVDCKTYGDRNYVGAKDVRSVIGALMTEPLTMSNGAKAIIVTTSAISPTANEAIKTFTNRFDANSPHKHTHPYMMEGWDRECLHFKSLTTNQRRNLNDQARTALVGVGLLELI